MWKCEVRNGINLKNEKGTGGSSSSRPRQDWGWYSLLLVRKTGIKKSCSVSEY